MKDLCVTVVRDRELMAAFSRMDISGLLADGDVPDLVHVHPPGRRERTVQRRAQGMGFEVLPMDVARFPVYVEQLSFPGLTAQVRTTGTTASARQFGSRF
ncbi:MAG TPA: hypothetical protein VMM15_41540 [Bradyrhizobium sp.]|nr:hypothetical protein [Bradyrhizobium sp.]